MDTLLTICVHLQTLWMGVILTGKMTFWGDKCLTKVDHAMKIGVLNIQAPVRMTHSPPRLQLQTLWIGVILTEKMTFWGDKSLTKVDPALKIGVLNIPAPIRMTPCPLRFYLTNQIIQNRQTTKSVILIPLKSLTFK